MQLQLETVAEEEGRPAAGQPLAHSRSTDGANPLLEDLEAGEQLRALFLAVTAAVRLSAGAGRGGEGGGGPEQPEPEPEPEAEAPPEGALDRDGVALIAKELELELSPAQLDQAMQQMDSTGSGTVDWPEFRAWVLKCGREGEVTPIRGVRRSVNPITLETEPRLVLGFDDEETPEADEHAPMLRQDSPIMPSLSVQKNMDLRAKPVIRAKSYHNFEANLERNSGIMGIDWLSYRRFFFACLVLTLGTLIGGVVGDLMGKYLYEPEYAIAIHGGAGTIDRDRMSAALEAQYRAELGAAAAAGEAVLAAGGGALDAVVAAVQRMEESELFNAGRGAVFTHAGTNEMDASIMDGRPDGLRNYTGGAGGATGRW